MRAPTCVISRDLNDHEVTACARREEGSYLGARMISLAVVRLGRWVACDARALMTLWLFFVGFGLDAFTAGTRCRVRLLPWPVKVGRFQEVYELLIVVYDEGVRPNEILRLPGTFCVKSGLLVIWW